MKVIAIDFSLLRKPWVILVALFVYLLPYTQLDFQHCYELVKAEDAGMTFNSFLQYILISKFTYALFAIIVLFESVRLLSGRLRADEVNYNIRGFLKLEGKLFFILVLAISFYLLVSVPVKLLVSPLDSPSNPDDLPAILLSGFSYDLAVGIMFSNMSVLRSIYDSNRRSKKTIVGFNSIEELKFDLEEIVFFSKERHKYFLHTGSKVYQVRKNLSQLESLTKENFFRVNRAVLANKKYISDVHFWEFDKFIVTLSDDEQTQHVMSRKRWNTLRSENQYTQDR